jgi:predicted phosphohydrolase
MTKLAWMTDIHLDHLGLWEKGNFFRSLADVECDAFLVTGDISNGRNVADDLEQMSRSFKKPIYFVLGNHDMWNSSVADVREAVNLARGEWLGLTYLNNVPYVQLSEVTALVGHDCWYDAMYGHWETSRFQMVDWMLMRDYSDLVHISHRVPRSLERREMQLIVDRSRELAAEGVRHLEAAIRVVLAADFKHIVVATHVPPFDEAHVFGGKKGDDAAQPWFTSKLLGDMLEAFAEKNPDVKFTSLSGHTHGKTVYTHRSNLVAHVGGARYEHPELQCVFEF